MKAQILKIAGVKNEKEFYRKFPTEEAFMEKHGEALQKAQNGFMGAPFQGMPSSKFNVSPNSGFNTNVSQNPYMSGSLIGGQKMQKSYISSPNTSNFGSKMKTLGSNIGEGVKKAIAIPDLSTPSGLAGMIGGIGAGINTIKQTDKNIGELEKYGKVSDVVLQATKNKGEPIKNIYDRPEKYLVQNMNPKGTGTNYLAAENGAEIANYYNSPNTIYTDGGFEPLNDSNVKQYKKGGKLKKADVGGIISAANSLADVSRASGQLGGGLGSQWGGAGGETGGYTQMLGGFGLLGGLVGGLLDAPQLKRKQQAQSYLDENTGLITGSDQLGEFTQQNSGFMENGGWVSNDWMPQTITKFGDYSMKELLAPPHDADMLRAGGHLKEYTPPNARAMYTGRDLPYQMEYGGQMAMGGDLKVLDGGYAETISYNPFMPGTGETVMFRGRSHDNGGIPVEYGQNGVEVEGGEPMFQMQDGGEMGNPSESNTSGVVAGNMLVDKFAAEQIGDFKAKDRKYKHVVADYAKAETKANKTIEKNTKLINDADTNDQFDKLSLNTGQASLLGANMKLKDIANKKMNLAAVQNAILDTAKEFGLESDALAKGKIKYAKANDPYAAKFGGKFTDAPIAQAGELLKPKPSSYKFDIRNYIPGEKSFFTDIPYARTMGNFDPIQGKYVAPELENVNVMSNPSVSNLNINPINAGWDGTDDYQYKGVSKKPKKNTFPWDTALQMGLTSLEPFFKPKYTDGVSPEQLTPAWLAASMNQLEPVKAQLYNPMLTQATSISFQDQLNEVTAQTRDAMRMAQGDPSALSMIASQAQQAKSKILGEQFRMNQAEKQRVNDQNINTLNDAQKTNLGILDQQYTRQETGKSKTKEQSNVIANKIAETIAQKKKENLMANLNQNLYGDYNISRSGEVYKNPFTIASFGPGMGRGSAQSTFGGMQVGNSKLLPTNYDDQGNPTHFKIVGSKTNDKNIISKNGAIVKAIKNL
jgi:hypothetical protein